MEKRAHLTILGFPVRFEVWFWLSMGLIASRTESLSRAALWIVLVTISILVHELGHALAYRRFGAEARISMWGMGGLTHGSNTDHLSPHQRIAVSAAGSTLEMVTLGFPAWALDQVWAPGGWIGLTLHWLFWINVVWALVNLAPVWPMDGGQIVDEVLYLWKGRSRRRTTHWISICAGVPISLYFFSEGHRWGGFLFLFFVFLNLVGLGVFSLGGTGRFWPEGDEKPDRPRRRSNRDKVANGYTSLRNDAGGFAQREAEEVLASSRSRSARRQATEMLAWAALAEGDLDTAVERMESVDGSSRLFDAALQLARGEDAAGIAALADALMAEPAHPAAEEAIVLASRSGHIGHVVDELLTHGTVGRGHAVRVHSVLEAVGLDDARRQIEQVI